MLYAMPPFRLKANPFLSILLDAEYAYAIPLVLAGYTFYLISGTYADVTFLMLSGGWSFVVGVRHYLNHICLDVVSDQRIGRRTLVTKYGVTRVRRYIAEGLVVAELTLLSSCLMYVAQSWWISLLLLLLLGVAICRYGHASAYRLTEIRIDKTYQYELIIGIGIISALTAPKYIWVVGGFMLLFAQIRWTHPLFQLLRGPASSIVNHGLYYFRKYVLLESEKRGSS